MNQRTFILQSKEKQENYKLVLLFYLLVFGVGAEVCYVAQVWPLTRWLK